MILKKHYFTLLLPLACAILFFVQGCFIYRPLLSLSCSIIVVLFADEHFKKRSTLFVALGLFVSIFADWFMDHSGNGEGYFVYGVILFFVAHCCYLVFSLSNGKINFIVLTILLVFFLSVFFFLFKSNTIVYIVILLYILISSFSFAAAVGLRAKGITKWLFVLGIGMIIISDTIIGFNMLTPKPINGLIMPTYFAFQIIMTAALLKR